MTEPSSRAAHPSALELETWHAGEPDSRIAQHLAACAACQGYIDHLEQLRATFREHRPWSEFLAQIQPERANAMVARPRRWLWAALAGPMTCVVFAAGLLFWQATRPPSTRNTLFKGSSMSLAVIVARAGRQLRMLHDPVHVRPGDRLRLELTLGQSMTLSAGVLEDDGSWLGLAEDVRLAPGVHYLSRAFAVDAAPTRARVAAGSPASIRRLRAGQSADDIAQIHLIAEGAPP